VSTRLTVAVHHVDDSFLARRRESACEAFSIDGATRAVPPGLLREPSLFDNSMSTPT